MRVEINAQVPERRGGQVLRPHRAAGDCSAPRVGGPDHLPMIRTAAGRLRESPMSWIRESDVSDGPIMKVMSIIPEAKVAVQQLSRVVTFGGSCLTPVQEEAISTAVSVANRPTATTENARRLLGVMI